MNYHGKIEETDTLIGNMGLGVDYYKGEQGEQGIPGKDGKDGSDQVYVGADEPTDERVKLWIDTDATPPSKTVSWDEIENKPNLADVATSGDYNDLSNKPTIPSTTGLASETYVNEKVAAIVIPEVPTKVSELENDKGYLTEHQSLAEYAKKSEIPAPYTLPTASTSILGGVKVDGNTITIADGVISSVGSTEPDAYIKDASVSGNTLTLTKKDNTNIVFTPSGGSSGGVSGYAFTSGQTFTDEDKLHLKEVYLNRNIHITIDSLTVIRIFSMGSKMAYVVINTNGATSNQVLVYTVNWDSSGNITSDTFALLLSYYLVGNSSALSGDVITSDNWQNYINVGGGDWNYTSYSDGSLYDAKELVIFYKLPGGQYSWKYINCSADQTGNTGMTLGTGNLMNQMFSLESDNYYCWFDGSSFQFNGSGTCLGVFYKT